jgi:hypothetical protein
MCEAREELLPAPGLSDEHDARVALRRARELRGRAEERGGSAGEAHGLHRRADVVADRRLGLDAASLSKSNRSTTLPWYLPIVEEHTNREGARTLHR